jgi:heterodisulfide reductase subunit B
VITKKRTETSDLKAIESIPDRKLLLFKSCMVGQEYPGVETATRYVFDRLGVDYCINDEQSAVQDRTLY